MFMFFSDFEIFPTLWICVYSNLALGIFSIWKAYDMRFMIGYKPNSKSILVGSVALFALNLISIIGLYTEFDSQNFLRYWFSWIFSIVYLIITINIFYRNSKRFGNRMTHN